MSTRGVVLFAYNTDTIDYYAMAVATAKRVRRFLKLPVSVVTDKKSITSRYRFDNTILISHEQDNYRGGELWRNHGRYIAGEVTPYDETLVIDTDYLINSTELSQTFDLPSDFVCYHDSTYLLENLGNETLGESGISLCWATVFRFRKTARTRDIFALMHVVQQNYNHYANVYRFLPHLYRNDYALTIALRTVNGQTVIPQDNIPGRLRHVGPTVAVTAQTNTCFDLVRFNNRVTVSNWDFHMLNKQNYQEIVA